MPNFCTSGMALLKAGKNVHEDFYSGMQLVRIAQGISGCDVIDFLISGACATINDMATLDFSTNYATLSSNTKLLLEDMASSMAAIPMIEYNMAGSSFEGYTSRVEAEDLVNINRDIVLRGLSIIREKKIQGFILRPAEGSA